MVLRKTNVRSAKNYFSIQFYVEYEMNVLKWCINCPLQSKNLNELLSLAGMRKSTESYKPLRVSEIKR